MSADEALKNRPMGKKPDTIDQLHGVLPPELIEVCAQLASPALAPATDVLITMRVTATNDLDNRNGESPKFASPE